MNTIEQYLNPRFHAEATFTDHLRMWGKGKWEQVRHRATRAHLTQGVESALVIQDAHPLLPRVELTKGDVEQGLSELHHYWIDVHDKAVGTASVRVLARGHIDVTVHLRVQYMQEVTSELTTEAFQHLTQVIGYKLAEHHGLLFSGPVTTSQLYRSVARVLLAAELMDERRKAAKKEYEEAQKNHQECGRELGEHVHKRAKEELGTVPKVVPFRHADDHTGGYVVDMQQLFPIIRPLTREVHTDTEWAGHRFIIEGDRQDALLWAFRNSGDDAHQFQRAMYYFKERAGDLYKAAFDLQHAGHLCGHPVHGEKREVVLVPVVLDGMRYDCALMWEGDGKVPEIEYHNEGPILSD